MTKTEKKKIKQMEADIRKMEIDNRKMFENFDIHYNEQNLTKQKTIKKFIIIVTALAVIIISVVLLITHFL